MPLYEFSCLAHGKFEKLLSLKAPIPYCPKGCSNRMVTKLVSAANIGSTDGKKQFIDRKTADLARQFGDGAMNDKYDSSRIDMHKNDDIQKKRMNGQTYSVPLDATTGIGQFMGSTGGSDQSLISQFKESGTQAIRSTTIVKDDLGKTTLPAE
jgi:putative FmdB family regulatory protein